MTKDEAALIATPTLDEAWPMVELFSTIRRESAAEGNRAIAALVERLNSIGVEPGGDEPAQTQAFVLAEIDRWAKVVTDTGTKMN